MEISKKETNFIKWSVVTILLILNTMPLSAQNSATDIDSVDWAIKKLTKLKVYNLYADNGWGSTPTGWTYQQIKCFSLPPEE